MSKGFKICLAVVAAFIVLVPLLVFIADALLTPEPPSGGSSGVNHYEYDQWDQQMEGLGDLDTRLRNERIEELQREKDAIKNR